MSLALLVLALADPELLKVVHGDYTTTYADCEDACALTPYCEAIGMERTYLDAMVVVDGVYIPLVGPWDCHLLSSGADRSEQDWCECEGGESTTRWVCTGPSNAVSACSSTKECHTKVPAKLRDGPGGVPNFVNVFEKLCRDLPECSLGTYLCDQLETAGLSLAEQSRVSYSDTEWLIDGEPTGIGAGGYNGACSSAFCAGGTTYGYGIDQARAVKVAFDNHGRYPVCSLGTYWCDQLETAGLSLAEQSLISYSDTEWLIDGEHTGIGAGAWNEECHSPCGVDQTDTRVTLGGRMATCPELTEWCSDDNYGWWIQSVCPISCSPAPCGMDFCAGGTTYGYGSQQAQRLYGHLHRGRRLATAESAAEGHSPLFV